MENPVAKVYDADPEREWMRLERSAFHMIEFRVTMHYLRKHLRPGSLVLDAGGGPGRYSLALCRDGHRVALLDLSKGLIDWAVTEFQAEPPEVRQRLVSAEVGDMRDLARFADGHFDATLCLGGPLSHVPDDAGRRKALSELVRVTRPGSIVCISVIGYLAMLRSVLLDFSFELLDPAYVRLRPRGDALMKGNVTHFFRARELEDLCRDAGLLRLDLAGCEGLSSNLEEATNRLAEDPAKWRAWLDLVLETASDPAVADMSEHILYVGRRP
ncbi:MAG: class I SAM-dependent methyltransferase [Bacillota bacterium]|nr:class I SAM-dependent methyltransferase [Bacillota bacterium]